MNDKLFSSLLWASPLLNIELYIAAYFLSPEYIVYAHLLNVYIVPYAQIHIYKHTPTMQQSRHTFSEQCKIENIISDELYYYMGKVEEMLCLLTMRIHL